MFLWVTIYSTTTEPKECLIIYNKQCPLVELLCVVKVLKVLKLCKCCKCKRNKSEDKNHGQRLSPSNGRLSQSNGRVVSKSVS